MIRGIVNNHLEAIVQLRLRGPGSVELVVDAMVDTGFNASLALSPTLVSSLGLTRKYAGGGVLADGSRRKFDVWAAEVLWDTQWKPVLVSEMGDDALLGMGLLVGHDLQMAVRPGCLVEITALP
jgi:clan AA aspartic protease